MSKNERYYCPESNCEIVASGLHGTYFVCRTCKLEVTKSLKEQKDQAKKDKAKKSFHEALANINTSEIEEALQDALLYGTGRVKIDWDKTQKLPPFDTDEVDVEDLFLLNGNSEGDYLFFDDDDIIVDNYLGHDD